MTWSFPVGRLFGSELRIHATFFLLLLWVGTSAWAVAGPAAAVFNVLFILALFFCVVAHEFGHALMARRFGIAIPDITLLPIGGVARLERMPKDPVQEIWVAVAGPAVNVAIWTILVVAFGASPGLPELQNLDNAAADFFGQLAAVNLMLVLFNLIPAFPMDGGRVLRAILALTMPHQTATSVAAKVGQVAAVGFALFGLLSGNVVLLLIAFFVFAAAAAENADVQMRSSTENVQARDAMITSFESLSPTDGLSAMSSGLLRTTQHEFPVLDQAGQLLGVVTRDAIFKAAADKGPRTVSDVMTGNVPRIELRAPLHKALDALGQPNTPMVAVTAPDGSFLGYISRENIGELMIMRRARGL